MLSVLKIKNIAIIEGAEISFSRGFNVLTGETGAGKSIILDSVNAVLGNRTSRELIRTGENSAEVSAVFSCISADLKEKLTEYGIENSEDDTVVISRVITPEKNICRVNGTLVNVAVLKELGKYLINIHGQQDNRELLNSETHLSYVDALSGTEELLKDYKEVYFKLENLKAKIRKLTNDKSERARKTDILNFQIHELTKASLRVGEWEDLRKKQTELQNFEKIRSAYNSAYGILAGDDENAGAVSMLSTAVRELSYASRYSEDAEKLSRELSEVYYSLSDIEESLRSSSFDDDYSRNQLEEIEERLDVLYRLSKKYGETEEEMLSFLADAEQELEELSVSDTDLEKYIKEKEILEKEVLKKAEELSKIRKTGAEDFSQKVCDELKFLDMPSVKFYVDFTEVPMCENGTDGAEFFISANIGEAPKPMAKISSGGELSRIMLAIKTVLSDKDKVPTLIFDEIDTGVSGRAAMKIASKLKEVSNGKQVISVTHLAQIASSAGSHYLIEKSSDGKKTYTNVTLLSAEQRKFEIARIIGGGKITELQLKSAEELLNNCGN